MKRKNFLTIFLAVLMAMAMAMSMSMTAFAAGWKENETDWWYATNADNTTWYSNGWQWIDGNYDGTAECYYFDENGYMLANTTTPDGYQVNASGAWVDGGVVQTRQMDPHTNRIDVATSATNGSEIMDGHSIGQITINQELVDMIAVNGLDKMPNRTEIGQGYFGPTYSTQYRGSNLIFETDIAHNYISSFTGIASQMLNGLPEQGIELNAFYDNTGYESLSTGRDLMASTGRSDSIFGLATGTYRMGWGNAGKRHFEIVLTQGEDGNWYIYPDSQMFMN